MKRRLPAWVEELLCPTERWGGDMLTILGRIALSGAASVIAQAAITLLRWRGYDLPLMVAGMTEGMIDSGAAGWLILGAAFFLTWLVIELYQRQKVSSAASAATLTPDLPSSGSNAIKGIASGDSWKKLNALLHSGEIMAWSRTEGYKNLRPIRPERWFNGSLEFLPSGDSFVADPGDLRPRPWKKDAAPKMNGRDYDIHFNRAQLKKHWPDLF